MTEQAGARRAKLSRAAAQMRANGVSTRSSELDVVDARAYSLREPDSGRRYTILRLETRSGIVGYGEGGTVGPDGLAQVREAVVGNPASAYELLRQQLISLSNVQAAVNIALLDILGRHTNVPIYQLLGGPTRNKARVIARLEGGSDEALIESMKRAYGEGIRAFLVPLPPVKARNQGQAFVQETHGRLIALKSAGDEGTDFAVDGGGQLSAGDASSLARDIEEFHLLWFDEPCRLSNLAVPRKISMETVTPIGFGRFLPQAGDFQDLLREEIVDVARPCVAVHGISSIRKISALAEAYYVAVAPYHDGGPIGTVAALHLAASLPNFFIQQIPFCPSEIGRRMRDQLTGAPVESVKDGFANLPTGPGLGVKIDEKFLEEHGERV